MLLCLNAVTRRGIAAWHFQKKTPEALQAAIRWDPRNAQYYDALATMRHFYADTDNPDEQVKLYQRAVNLSPQNALYWADLGTAFDWAGNRSEALRAFERAQGLTAVSCPVESSAEVCPIQSVLRAQVHGPLVKLYLFIRVVSIRVEVPHRGQRVVVLCVVRIPADCGLQGFWRLFLKMPGRYPSSCHRVETQKHACCETAANGNALPTASPVEWPCQYSTLGAYPHSLKSQKEFSTAMYRSYAPASKTRSRVGTKWTSSPPNLALNAEKFCHG